MEHVEAIYGPEKRPLAEWESEFRDRMRRDGIADPRGKRSAILTQLLSLSSCTSN